jgi:hypothetical protein
MRNADNLAENFSFFSDQIGGSENFLPDLENFSTSTGYLIVKLGPKIWCRLFQFNQAERGLNPSTFDLE